MADAPNPLPPETLRAMATLPDETLQSMHAGLGDFARKKALRAANELARRQIEALELYRPTEIQDQYHSCTAVECLFQAGNQVGKSLAGFVEDARAALGKDPYNKYPKRDGGLVILGYKERHIGMVVYPYLFKAGAFKIIRDTETGLWRVWRPWVPQDKEREAEAKPAPPLIPKRYVKKIAWKDKSKGVFSRVDLTTGWEIHAFSSTSKPDQGFKCDLAHIDEDIINEHWYSELMARLTMRKGKLRWTALPHNENDALNRVAERGEDQAAEEQRSGTKPTTVIVRATIYDNPFMTDEARKANVERWKGVSDEEYRKRALGELVTDSVRMYPTWSRHLHGVRMYEDSYGGLFKQYLRKGQVPHDWCLWMTVDPGFDTCAVLFGATPPDHDVLLVWDELYLRQCTASMFGQAVERKVRGRWFQRFVIDAHGGNLTSMDTGLSPREAYEQQLSRLKVKCIETGHRFTSGCDQIQYRETILREKLSLNPSGVPTIVFDEERCPNLDKEMTRFKKQKINGVVIDKGNRRSATHAVECLEYMATMDLKYVKPPSRKIIETPGQARVRAYRERKNAAAARNRDFGTSSTIILGPQGVYS